MDENNNNGGRADDNDVIISVTYTFEGPNGERLEETVDFPAQQGVIDALLEKAGVDGARERVFYMEDLNSKIDGLIDAIDAIADTFGVHPNELNALAGRINALDQRGREDFSDMVEMTSSGLSIDVLNKFADLYGKPSVMQVYIENAYHHENGGFTIPLPTTREYIKAFCDGIEVLEPSDVCVMNVRSREVDFESAECFRELAGLNLDELNYLAARFQAMDDDDREIIAAVVESGRHGGSLAEIINVTHNTANFYLQPAVCEEILGDHLLNCDADNCGAGFQKLYASTDEELRGVLKYIEVLEKHFDAEAYGKEYSENEHGVFTRNGYLTEAGGFREVYHGLADIPAEYRVLPDELSPLLKAADVDLLPFLVKLQAVTDTPVNSIDRAVREIVAGRGEDYLLMVNSVHVYATEALSAYKRGEVANSLLQSAGGKPEERVFHLSVTDRGEDGTIKCDIAELRRADFVADIAKRGIMPDRFDVVEAGGARKSYDLLEWADTSLVYRREAQSVTRHYTDADTRSITAAFNRLSATNVRKGVVTDETALLAGLSAAFMATEYPQPDMLRIANAVAKEILARNHADVYALTESGALKIPPIEAAKGRFVDREDLAIRREDGSALDKYAHNAVKRLLRDAERGERDKFKSKGGDEI